MHALKGAGAVFSLPKIAGVASVTLVLRGKVPSKKNVWRHGKGRTYIDRETKALIDALTAQAQSQWNRAPVTHPDMRVQFFVRDKRRDRDNLLTTLLDCLREAGVIVNDNIAQFNGTLVLLPSVIDQNERVTVAVENKLTSFTPPKRPEAFRPERRIGGFQKLPSALLSTRLLASDVLELDGYRILGSVIRFEDSHVVVLPKRPPFIREPLQFLAPHRIWHQLREKRGHLLRQHLGGLDSDFIGGKRHQRRDLKLTYLMARSVIDD
jgi:Holliday junction resolvase RusA-like endonuclease